jgi:hypothetical protein
MLHERLSLSFRPASGTTMDVFRQGGYGDPVSKTCTFLWQAVEALN